MAIHAISGPRAADPFKAFEVEFDGFQAAPIDGTAAVAESSFADTLKHALQEVDASKSVAEQLTLDFATGKPVDVHTMMIAVAKSDVMMQLASSVVSKTATGINQLLQTQI